MISPMFQPHWSWHSDGYFLWLGLKIKHLFVCLYRHCAAIHLFTILYPLISLKFDVWFSICILQLKDEDADVKRDDLSKALMVRFHWDCLLFLIFLLMSSMLWFSIWHGATLLISSNFGTLVLKSKLLIVPDGFMSHCSLK